MNLLLSRLWQRGLLWILAGVVWLAILSLPAVGLLLAVRGELSWHQGEHRDYRVWLVSEKEERGLGWEFRRAVSRSADRVCLQTTVAYWLWRGKGEQTGSSFCECYKQRPDPEIDYLGACAAIDAG